MLEEAVHLLRARPLDLTAYYIGTLPFILGFIYFFTEMSTGAFAWKHLPHLTLMMVLLFAWMKAWQALFAGALLRRLEGSFEAFRFTHFLRALFLQTAIQPWGIIAVPVALIALLPFPRVLSFFQNITVFGDGREPDTSSVVKRSWHQASLWPMQSSVMIWLASPILATTVLGALAVTVLVVTGSLSLPSGHDRGAPDVGLLLVSIVLALAAIPLCPLGIVVALNIGVLLYEIPWLLKTFFGLDTSFAMMGSRLFINSTYIAIVCGLTYLCLDPLFKAAYVLRCFYGDSLTTGKDLLAGLNEIGRRRNLKAIVVGALLLTVLTCNGLSAEMPAAGHDRAVRVVRPEELNSAIERVLESPSYAWRMPREKPPVSAREDGIVSAIGRYIADAVRSVGRYVNDWLQDLIEWVRDLLQRLDRTSDTPSSQKNEWPKWSMIVVGGLLLILLALAGFFYWKTRVKGNSDRATPVAAPSTAVPDIRDEEIDVTALPEEGWLAMARDWIEKGDLRLALRAFYLATLATLASSGVIIVERYKSDREYETELRRRSHAFPDLIPPFSETRRLFEGSWYGNHEVTMDVLEQASKNQEALARHGR
jgi:hypothetical protein